MTDIKLVIFDIDGTLISETGNRIEDSAVDAIHQLKAKGIKVLIATGRTIYFINLHVREIVDPDYFVTINGQCLLNRQERIIIRHDLNSDSVKKLHDFCVTHDVAMGIKYSDAIYVTHNYLAFAESYSQGKPYAEIIRDDTATADHYLTQEPAMGIFLIGHPEQVMAFSKEMPEFAFTAAREGCTDVCDRSVNKTKGIEEVLKLNNLNWFQVMAFGDGENDTDMLKKAGYGIAMGNAKEHVRQFADFVTKEVDQGGIMHALTHYKVI